VFILVYAMGLRYDVVTGWVWVWVYQGDVCERYGLVSVVNGLQVVGFVMFRNA